MPFKNVNMPGWSKGKFALFQMPETGGTVAGICPKADPPPHNQGVRAFIDRVGGGVVHAETAESSLTVIFNWSSVV